MCCLVQRARPLVYIEYTCIIYIFYILYVEYVLDPQYTIECTCISYVCHIYCMSYTSSTPSILIYILILYMPFLYYICPYIYFYTCGAALPKLAPRA